jgi:hypothetical protein
MFKILGEIGVIDLNKIRTIGSFMKIGLRELGEQCSALVFKSMVCEILIESRPLDSRTCESSI